MTLSSSRLTPGPRRPLSWVERTTGLVAFHRVLLRRTWRGEAVSRFLTPVLFLAAMGVGVGGLVDRASGGVGGVPYLVVHERTALLVPPGDPARMSAALVRVALDPALAKRLAAEGLQEAQRYTWARVRGTLAEVYQRALDLPGEARSG